MLSVKRSSGGIDATADNFSLFCFSDRGAASVPRPDRFLFTVENIRSDSIAFCAENLPAGSDTGGLVDLGVGPAKRASFEIGHAMIMER